VADVQGDEILGDRDDFRNHHLAGFFDEDVIGVFALELFQSLGQDLLRRGCGDASEILRRDLLFDHVTNFGVLFQNLRLFERDLGAFLNFRIDRFDDRRSGDDLDFVLFVVVHDFGVLETVVVFLVRVNESFGENVENFLPGDAAFSGDLVECFEKLFADHGLFS